MRLFLCFALAVCIGTCLGLFGGGENQISGSSSIRVERAGTGTVAVSSVQRGKSRVKRLLRPKQKPKYGPSARISTSEMVSAAKKLAPYTRVPANILVGIADQETSFGKNWGKVGRSGRGRSISEQVLMDVLAERQGLGGTADGLPVSAGGAFGLVQARPSYYLHHTGMEVDFGKAPVILLHGTERYRNLSRTRRSASIKSLQRTLGLRGSDVDGAVGVKTLDAIQRSIGTRSFGKVAKYRLVKRHFADQITIRTSKSRDRVWQRICRAEGKDPQRAEYSLPNLFNPLHALAYASVHIEDDLQLAQGNLGIAISAYYTGIGDAKKGCEKGRWYKGQVLAKAKKYTRLLLS